MSIVKIWRACIILVWMLIVSSGALADVASVLPHFYAEPGTAKNRQLSRSLDIPDQVDPFSGSLGLSHVDLVIPGNGGLDIKITRSYSSNIWLSRPNIFSFANFPNILLPPTATGVGWTMHFGRVILAERSGNNPCEKWSGFLDDNTSNNAVLELPDGSMQALYVSMTGVADFVTKSMWLANCYENGQGLTIYSPDGLKYTMNHRVYSPNEANYTGSSVNVWYPTRVEDGKGNYFTITYSGATGAHAHFDRISASDGRTIDFTYSGGVLTQISGAGQTWRYDYQTAGTAAGHKLLTRVRMPEGKEWTYTYRPGNATLAPWALDTVTGPYGADVAYTYGHVNFQQGVAQLAGQDPWLSVSVLTRKLNGGGGGIGGGGLPSVNPGGTWTYTYSPGGDTSLEPGLLNDVTTVTLPGGSETYIHYGIRRQAGKYGSGAEDLWKTGLLAKKIISGGGSTREETYTWQAPYVISREINIFPPFDLWEWGVSSPQLQSKTVIQDGTQYATNYGYNGSSGQSWCGNSQVGCLANGNDPPPTAPLLNATADLRPTSITEAGQSTRITGLTWFPASPDGVWRYNEKIVESYGNNIGHKKMRQFDYSTGNVEWQAMLGNYEEYTYTNQGDIRTRMNGRGFISEFSNYYRGLPRNESHPVDNAGNITVSRTVNSSGTIASEVNSRGYTTSYTYDDLNRITGIGRPRGAAVSVNWSSSSRTVTRGNYQERTYYDNLGRPYCIETVGGGDTVTKVFRYNALGHKIFESYPFSGGCSSLASQQGDRFTTDILGRVTQVTHADNSTRGYDYLSGNRVQVTNERGQVTTYHYRSFGDPSNASERVLMRVDAPEGVSTVFTRDIIGQITSVTQGGVTRSYTYDPDTNFLLTVTNPETGTTVFERDGVGNMLSSRVGASEVTNYGYDALNRLRVINYPGATPDVLMEYDANGNLTRVANFGSSNTQTGIVQISTDRRYGFDENDNLLSESLKYVDQISTLVGGNLNTVVRENKTLQTTYSYNDIDFLTSVTYPSTRVVTFSPNGLGRATEVAPFVSSISYHPTGQPSALSYANGRQTTIAINNRQWTERIATSGLVDLTYGYDGVGNVRSITDAIDSQYTQTLDYDGIDRLTVANGVWGTGSISYDTVGNISSKNLGSQSLNYVYDTANRLASMSGSRAYGFSYDAYGNVVSNGNSLFTYNDANNLTYISGAAAAGYVYDGKNLRVREQKGANANYFFYAKNGSLLGEYSIDGARYKEYAYLGSKLVAMREVGVQAPTANAGANQTVSESAPVALDGSASSDADGVVASFAWTQMSGPTVTLTGANTAAPSFTAPYVSADTVLTFRLTIADNDGATSSATVNVTVVKVSLPSVVSGLLATAGNTQNTLTWQPATAPPTAGPITYNLYWSTTPGVTKANGTRISNVASPYAHTGLANGTRYYYIVAAQNSAGEAPASSEVSAQTGVSSWGGPFLLEYNDLGSVAYSIGNPTPAPSLQVDSDGTARVAWVQTDGVSNRLWTRGYNPANGWGAPLALPDISVSSFSFQIWSIKMKPLNAGGDIVAATVSGNSPNNLAVSRYSPGSGWSSPAYVANAGGAGTIGNFDVAGNLNGNAVVAWANQSGVYARYYQTSAGAWGDTVTIQSGNLADRYVAYLSMDINGNVILVSEQRGSFINGAGYIVYGSLYTASTYNTGTGLWSHYGVGLSTAMGGAFHSTPDGKAIAAHSWDGQATAHLYDPASGWTRSQLPGDGSSSGIGRVDGASISSTGHAVVAWSTVIGITPPASTVYAIYHDPVNGWEPSPTAVAQLPVTGPYSRIATHINTSGSVAIGWLQSSLVGVALRNYWVAHRISGMGWRPPVMVAQASTENYTSGGLLPIVNEQLRLDASGNTLLVWQQGKNDGTGLFDLMGAQYAALGGGFPHQNASPVAHAGTDQTAIEGTLVTLDGTRSFDPDGTIASYSWRQTTLPGLSTNGPAVTLSNADTATPSFPPSFEGHPTFSQGYTFGFILTVTDDQGASSSSSVTVRVTDLPSPKIVQTTPGNGQNTIGWNSTSANSYNIYWSTSPGVTKTNSNVITAVSRPYVHQGLTNVTTYYYAVSAIYGADESPLSPEVSATPTPSPVPDVWGSPLQLGSWGGSYNVTMDPNGNAFAIWGSEYQQGSGQWTVRAARFVAESGWSEPVVISGPDPQQYGFVNGGGGAAMRVAADGLGGAMAIWVSSLTDANNVYRWVIVANRYDPISGWGAPVIVSPLVTPSWPGSHAGSPSVALDAAGNAMAVWTQGNIGNGLVYAARYAAGSGWSVPQLIQTGSQVSTGPKVVVDANGNALAVWALNGSTVYANRYLVGTGWQGAQLLGYGNPNVAINDSGSGIITWQAPPNYYLYARRLHVDGTLGPAAPVYENIRPGAWTVGVDASGNATIVWYEDAAGKKKRVYASQSANGGAWTAPVLIQGMDIDASSPQTGIGADGNVVVTWLQSDASDKTIYSNRLKPGIGWLGDRIVSYEDVNVNGYLLATAENGDALVLYSVYGGALHSTHFNARKTNSPPAASGGPGLTVDAGSPVLLRGRATDVDGTIANYAWSQMAGPSVTLSDANMATARFVAPQVTGDTVFTFRVTVTDNDGASGSATVNVTVRVPDTNVPPTALPGPSYSVNETASVILAGAGSDPDGTIAAYLWTQTAGPTVTLTNANTATASFTAPTVAADTVLTFLLTVTDNQGKTDSAPMSITVRNLNQPPVANAGSPQTVNKGSVVTLAGSGTDTDGTIASYQWTQTAGPAVTLATPNAATTAFTAPLVTADTVLTFQLTVTDNSGATGTAATSVTVLNVNSPPTANAGANQTMNEGVAVTLTGSATDPDGTIATYAWTQTAGPAVTINNANTATANFTAPQVTANTVLTFQLTVTDNNGASASASTNVTVNNVILSPQVASVTTSTFGTNTTAHAVAMPAAVSAGDLLLMLVASDGRANQTTPSGWTALFLNQRSGTAVTFSAYTKIASGTEGGTTVNVATSAIEQAAAQVYRVTGWYGTLSGVVSSSSATGISTGPDPGSLTPSWGAANTLWIAAHAADHDATRTTTAYPANYTGGQHTQSNTGPSAVHVASAQRTLNAVSENPGAFTMSASDNWIARTIAIRPAP